MPFRREDFPSKSAEMLDARQSTTGDRAHVSSGKDQGIKNEIL